MKDKRQCSDAETWRTLTEGFIEYVQDLDITNTYPNSGGSRDGTNLQYLRSTEAMGHKIAKVARYLLDIRPPDDQLYVDCYTESEE